MITCMRVFEFDAAHRIIKHGGKCRSLHGHRYKVELEVAGKRGAEGFVMDFGLIKERVGSWIDEVMDHTTILEDGDSLIDCLVDPLRNANAKDIYVVPFSPTAENLAEHIGERANRLIPVEVEVVRCRVWETPNCYGEWS